MIHRLTASKNPLPCSNDEIEIIEAEVDGKPVPEEIQIDVEDYSDDFTAHVPHSQEEESANGIEDIAPLIPKEEVDTDDGFIVPKIEVITGGVGASNSNRHHGSDSSDDDQAIDDDFIADPNFDPNESNSEESENEEVHISPGKETTTTVIQVPTPAKPNPTPSSLTVCETCNLRFLSATSFKIHMKECHNEYSLSDDDDDGDVVAPPPPPSPPPQSRVQFNCKVCLLPFATSVGLRIHTHTHTKHKETKIPNQDAPKKQLKPKDTDTPVQKVLDPPQQPIVEKVVYVCSFPDCDVQFYNLQNMKIHKALQHEYRPNKPIVCSLCPAHFREPIALLYHLKKNHPDAVDEEGYREFARFDATVEPRRKELAKRTRETPTCVLCNISFQWEANLQNHMRLYHDNLEIDSSSSVTGNKQKSKTNAAASSPLLAAALEPMKSMMSPKGSHKSVPEHEKPPPPLPEIQIIDLSDDEKKDEIETIDKHRRKSQQKSSTSRIKPFNTMCPYCTKTFSSEALENHIEKTHANVTTHKVKKFSCPFSGCRKTFNLFEEVQTHHKSSHQGKCPTTPAATAIQVNKRQTPFLLPLPQTVPICLLS